MSFHIIFCHDSGTSEGKGAIIPLQNGKPLSNYAKMLHLETLGLLKKDGPDTGFAITGPGSLVHPQQYAGLYGKRARESGAVPIRYSDIYRRPEYFLFHFSMLAELLNQYNLQDGDVVQVEQAVIGFPTSHVSEGTHLAHTLQQGIDKCGEWVVKAGEKLYHVRYSDVLWKSQPFFMAIDQIFQVQDGKFSDARGKALLRHGPVIIMDWGSNSIDMIYLPGTFQNAKEDCHMVGTFNLLPEIRRLAYEETGQDLSDYEALYTFYRLHQHTEGIEKILATIMPDLRNDINLFLKKLPVPPHQLVCGGGGSIHAKHLLRQTFRPIFPGGVSFTVDDTNKEEVLGSILRGMTKWGLIQRGRKTQ